MPVKTILVHLPSERSAAPTLESALKIASPSNAHVTGLHLIRRQMFQMPGTPSLKQRSCGAGRQS
jgi:hypothetical protein